ncbi:MAG: protoheme IX farnesyltransferase, partial [Halobacteriota archaeon]
RIVLAFGATWLAMVALAITVEFGLLYSVTLVGLGGLFLLTVVEQYRQRSDAAALRSFYASNLFLGGVLLAIVLESLVV